MECVHKVLPYSHLVDFFFLCTFFKSKVLFMKERLNLIKPQGCCFFPQTDLLHRSVMQTIQFLPSESCTGMLKWDYYLKWAQQVFL